MCQEARKKAITNIVGALFAYTLAIAHYKVGLVNAYIVQ